MIKHFLTAFFLLFAAVFSVPSQAQAQDIDWVVNLNDTGSDPVAAGGTVVYNLIVNNGGSDPAPATSFSFTIPTGTTLTGIAGFSGCTTLPLTGPATATCAIPPLLADAEVSGTLSVLTTTTGTITVQASVPTAGDVLPGNNTESETTSVIAGANLRMDVIGPATATAGSSVTYTLRTTNLGPNTASGMVVDFPPVTGFQVTSAPPGCTLSGSTYLCPIPGSMLTGDIVNLNFVGNIIAASGSTVTPLAGVTAGTPPDPIPNNNTNTLNTTVTAGSDLRLTKTRAPSGNLLVGNTATFTLTPSYTGDNPSAITLTDTLPANYTPVSATGTGWTCTITGQLVSCTRPTGIGAGNNITLPSVTLTATIISAGTPTNSATVTASSPVDPNPANNTATDGGATLVNPTIDLRANKSGPRPPLTVIGNTYAFPISTTNIGTAPFFGTVRMVDSIPAGLTVTSLTANGWTCLPALPLAGPATLTCERIYTSLSPLNPGQTTPNVVVNALVTATGAATNTLTVSSPNPNLPDNNGPNNTTSVTTTGSTGPASADVAVIKNRALSTVVVGDVQTYTLEITNTGPQAALNIELTDTLDGLMNNGVGPTGQGYIGHTITANAASGVSCNTAAASATARTLTCTVASLPICIPGSTCPTVSIQVRPGGDGGARTNSATAFSQTIADPDTSNNTSNVTFNVTPRSDVIVNKVASPNPAIAGQNLTYVVTATNVANGLSSADNVSVIDSLPAGMTFVSATPSTGTCSVAPTIGATTVLGDTVQCNLGTIANGAQRTLTIIVRPNNSVRGTNVTNAVAVSTTTPETDTTNNNDSITTFVDNPRVDLLINKTDSIDPVAIGDDTVYTVTVTNNGPSFAENVVMTDTLPPTRLRYRSHVVSGGGSCNIIPVDTLGGTLTCSWPSLGVGQSRNVTITMRGDTKSVATNVATVSSDETLAGFESNAANNTASQLTTVRTRADMQVFSKVPSADPVNLRENFFYTIELRNNGGLGLSEADDVIMSDTLPAGMQLTGTPTISVPVGSASIQTCTGTSGSTSFTCSLGTVASGSRILVNVPVRIVTVTAYPQTFTNTASVTTSSLDVVPANNSNSSSMIINSSSLTGRLFRDFNNNAAIDVNDTGISGITMTLSGTAFDGAPISVNATTAADGTYTFPFVPQGTYTVTQGGITETYLNNGTNTVGNQGGTLTGSTQITNINLPSNTAASGYLFAKVPVARLGLAKNVQGAISVLSDGSVRATLRHTLRNYSLEPLINVSVTDPLNGLTPNRFGTYVSLGTPATDPMTAGTYTVYNASTTCGAGTLNAGFNGSSNTTLLSGVTRPIGTASCTVDFIIRYQPPAPLPTPATGNRWENQSTMIGEGQYSGQTSLTNPQLIDLSHSGTNPDSDSDGIATDNNTPTPVSPTSPTFTPVIQLRKTADISGFSNPVAAGNTITYSFDVRNNGNQTLTNVTVNDPRLGGAVPGSPIASILPGQTVTLTAPYTVTTADIAGASIDNQATATGTHTLNAALVPQTVTDQSGTDFTNNTPTSVQLGRIALIKTVNTSGLSSPVQVGDTLTYAFEVRNTGGVPLTNVTITDPLPGIVLSGAPISLGVGATNTTNFTATYTITQADINAGRVDNQATVTGQWGVDGLGNPIVATDLSGTNATNNTPTRAVVPQNPQIRLIKTADNSAVQTPAQVGNTITYGFRIENTGNVTLNNVTLTDPLSGLVLTGTPIASMAPGAVNNTAYTATYALTQTDINNGRVVNQATVTGAYTDINNTPRTTNDLSGTANTNNTPTESLVPQSGSITLVKTVNTAGLASPPVPGNPLTYNFAITNTGNVTLSNVTVTDPLTGIVLTGTPIPTLAPGASNTVAYTASYAILQADINRGYVENQATVTGTYRDATNTLVPITDLSGTVANNDTPTRAPITQAPAIALIKSVSTSGLSTPPVPGDIANYTFTVRNTGNTTLTNVTVTDPLTGIVLTGSPIPTLAPGATNNVTYSATYALTQTDIDAGFVENQATVEGDYTDETGAPQSVTDLSGTALNNDTPTRLVPLQVPSIALVKTVDTSALSSPAAPGDTLSYTFTITNTGNTTLTNVGVTDPLPGMTLVGTPVATLAPGASTSLAYTGSYDITQSDIDAGFVENQATVEGSYIDETGTPQTVDDLSGTNTANDTPTVADGLQDPEIVVTKTVDTSALSSPVVVGDTLSYTFELENTGNTTLTNVTITDPLVGLVLTGTPVASMAPGDVDTSTYTATYTITQADIDAGRVNNTATATGGYVDPILGASTTTDTDNANAIIPQDPSIDLVKTISGTSYSSPVEPGDTITYAFRVENTGNVTLNSVTITDPLPGLVMTGTPFTLAPGDVNTVAYTATYTLTQADIDAGRVDNQALVTGSYTDLNDDPLTVTDLSGTTTGTNNDTTALITQEPAITLVKTVDTTGLSSPPVPGDELTYGFTFTNTGNVTLTNVTITDPMTGLVLTGAPVPSMAPGATNTTAYSASYILTQADIDAGFVENQATVEGDYSDANGTPQSVDDLSGTLSTNDTPTLVSNLQSPAIVLVKTVDTTALSSPPVPGELLSYAFEIRNTGNTTLTDVTVTDPLTGIVLVGTPVPTMAPGAINTTAYTATYAITQTDIDTGFVENQATVEGDYTDQNGNPQSVDDLSGTAINNDDTTVAPLGQFAQIRLVKTADTTGLSTPVAPGDEITYAFTITNTGNTTLNDVTLTDPLVGLTLTGTPITSMAPGDINTTAYTASYILTQADIDAGFVENQATVEGNYTDAGGNPQSTSDISGTLNSNDTPTTVDNLQSPSIALIKTVDDSALSSPPVPGETVNYAFEIRNTGNTTLTNVTLTDPLIGLTLTGTPIATMAPGAINTTAYTGSYSITQTDINAGFVENQATVEGDYTDQNGNPQSVDDLSGTTINNDTPVTLLIEQAPAIRLVKTADESALSTPRQPGDIISYAFQIENIGNVTLNNVTITDPLSGIVLTGTPFTMEPGDVNTTAYTATYAITQADIDAGFVENQATVEGAYTDATGTPQSVDDLSGTNTTNDTPTTVQNLQTPAIVLVKTVDTSALSSPPVPGELLTYAFEIRNTGNTTLTDVTITDPLVGLTLTGTPIASMAPGAINTTAYTATYAITQADIDAGLVENQATATGDYTDQNGNPQSVDDLSGTTINNDDTTVAAIDQNPEIRLIKTSDTSGYSTPTQPGDTITYAFRVENTGNVTLNSVTITDTLPGLVLTGAPFTLAPGQVNTTAYTATYDLTQGDIDTGFVENQAEVTGSYTDLNNTPQTTTDLSGTTNTNDTPTLTPVPQSPSIRVVKTADTSGFSSPVVPGDTIAYTFSITNTGNTTLTNVTLTDPLVGLTLTGAPIASMAPGETNAIAYSATYDLTQADIDAGFVENQATVEGNYTDETGTPQSVNDLSGSTTSNDTPTTTLVPQSPSITLVKNIDLSSVTSPAQVGQTVFYTFTIQNTGNTTLDNVIVTDPMIGLILTGMPITLAPGQSDTTTYSATYDLTQADLDAGFVENQATVEGVYTDATGTPQTVDDLSGTDATNDTPTVGIIGQNAAIALVKTVDASALSTPPVPGDILTYGFLIENTGNVTLDNVTVTDPLTGIVLVGTPFTMQPGDVNSTAYTATYALTQADIDTGFVENQATVEGDYFDALGNPQTTDDLSGTTATNDTPTTQAMLQFPSLALVKTVDTTSLSTPPQPGDVLAYTFVVTNTGNTTLTDVTIADPLPNLVLTGSPITLAPGESNSIAYSATYALTQTDINNGRVDNQAEATGSYTDETGAPQTVEDLSGTDTTNDTPTTALINQDPGIALVKTVDASALSTPVQVGDTLTYAFAVTNTGNTTLTNVTLTDPLVGLVLNGAPISTLEPGDTNTTAYTATYTLTQDDINTGFVENQANVEGTYTDETNTPQTVTDDSGTDVTNDTPTVQPIAQTPAVSLTKTIDTSLLSNPPQVGETVTYAFTIENIGNTTLDTTVTDPMPGLILTGNSVTLAPGESDSTTYTATYQLTQNDLDAGRLDNTATVTGLYTDGTGNPQSVIDTDSVEALLTQQGQIALVKTVDTSALNSPAQIGDVLTYTFTATNTSLITLTNVTLNDPLPGIVLPNTNFGTLAPGASATLNGTYALTQADLDAGEVINQATVEGTYTDGGGNTQTTTDQSGTTPTTDDPTVAPVGQNPSIALIKRAFVDNPGGIAAIGDTIRYTFEITNTGNVTLTNVVLSDTLAGLVLTGGPIASLAPGAVDTATYTGVYAVTAQDFVNAEVINQATVEGTYNSPGGGAIVVNAVSGTDATNTDPTVVEIGLPSIDLAIAVSGTEDRNTNGRLDLGDGVVFTFTVTNTGNVPLTDVNIIPDSMSLDFPNLVCQPVSLAVGETITLTCTGNVWTVTQEDVDTGSITLTGTAEGSSPALVVVSDSDATLALPVSQSAAATTLLMEKIANVTEVRIGDTVTYTLRVRHQDAGGLPVDVNIVDQLPTGLAYVEGSATLNGVPVNPQTTGRTLTFPSRTLIDGDTLIARLDVRVTSAAEGTTLTNQAWASNGTTRLSNIAEATIRLIMEPVFSCGTVIGRVFADIDQNGHFNSDTTNESGIGGVRLVAPNGVSVITDAHGRYNLPCEALPSVIGSNFQLKLDERTLPTGYVLTTENPRVVRLTAGMVTRLDFGVNTSQPVRIDLDARAFNGTKPTPALQQALMGLIPTIEDTPSVVRIVYQLQGDETTQQGRLRARAVERMLDQNWKGSYPLRIEIQLLRRQ